MNFCDFSVLL